MSGKQVSHPADYTSDPTYESMLDRLESDLEYEDWKDTTGDYDIDDS